MATRRIRFVSKRPELFEPDQQRALFLADLLSGRVTATRFFESRDIRGNAVIDYDDPTGVGLRADTRDRNG